MKSRIYLFSLLISPLLILAQSNRSLQPRISFSAGFASPQFFGGTELLRAENLRSEGLSYYENTNNERAATGSYGPNTGFSLGIAYYIPVGNEKWSLGLLVNSAQTGSSPSIAGFEEGYFFNYLNFGLGLQYYPLADDKLYFKAEAGMGSVFTKNRFINGQNEQDFLHHFGIGMEAGAGLGYTFRPFTNKNLGLNLQGLYQYYNTRVEVSGIGNDNWQFGSLNISLGLQF